MNPTVRLMRQILVLCVLFSTVSCANTTSSGSAQTERPIVSVPTSSTPNPPPSDAPSAIPMDSAPAPVASATPAACLADPELDAFASGLLADLAARDPERLASRVSDTFDFVVEGTDVAIPPMSADEAAAAMIDGLPGGFQGYRPLAPGALVVCLPGVTPAAVGGDAILEGLDTEAFLTTGWGASSREEAFVYLARQPDGTPYWRGIWYSLAGFER